MLMAIPVMTRPVMAGDITGTVTDDSTSQPIVGLDMNIYDSEWNFLSANAVTAAGGIYRFIDLAPGDYYVRANPKYPFHYQHKYWNDAVNRDTAIKVTVPETGEVAGIDFSLVAGWFIVGKVSELQSGAVLNGINIRVYDPEWNWMDVVSETDQYGRYYIGGLPGGQYYVMADPAYPEPHVDQYFDHSAGPIHAIPVILTPPNDLLGVSFDLESGSYILGEVTDKDTGDFLSGIRVRAYNSSGDVMRINDKTDDDGRYVLGAYPVSDYYVRVDPSYPRGYMDQYFLDAYSMDSAQRVTVSLPKPAFDINFALPAGSYMRGTVTDSTGQPINDIKVKFYDRNWQYLELATTYTREDGTYLSGALKPGMYYVKAVPIYPQPWIDQYFPNAVTQGDAEQIPMALASETTGIDLSLQPGGYLTGTITHQTSGEPLAGVDLDVYSADWGWINYSDHTSSSGRFIIGALPFSTYFLHADPYVTQGFVSQFYDRVFMPNDAVLITISEGQNGDNLDFILDDGGFVTGKVSESQTGLPLESIEISVFTMNEDPIPIHTVKTDATGEYVAYGIPGGSYYVAASMDTEDDYLTQYYQHASTISDAVAIPVVPLNTVANIDFDLDADPKPTATPAVTLGVTLEMPSDTFRYKDLFFLNARVSNPGQLIEDVPLFVILDIAGEMFFWPSWAAMSTGIDYQLIYLENGVRVIPILPAFEWPKVSGSMTGIHFYSGMTRPDFSRLLGDMDTIAFGYTDE